MNKVTSGNFTYLKSNSFRTFCALLWFNKLLCPFVIKLTFVFFCGKRSFCTPSVI
jgi:hypothetical protein